MTIPCALCEGKEFSAILETLIRLKSSLRGVHMPEWINVKDKMPPSESNRVLATNGEEICICQVNKNLWYVGTFGGDAGGLFSPEPYTYNKYLENVTHWMPLPEFPK